MTETGKAVASKEQDIMIRAFDYVVRANRKDKSQAVLVIGNAMEALSSVAILRQETFNHIRYNLDTYPPSTFARWLREAFLLLRHHRKFVCKTMLPCDWGQGKVLGPLPVPHPTVHPHGYFPGLAQSPVCELSNQK